LSTDQNPSAVYVQSFPQPGTKQQLSTKGAITLRWSRDGKEMFYLARDATMMALSVESAGSSLETGTPKPLFKAPVLTVGVTRDYDVAADGGFLINVTNPTGPTPISVILNWPSSLK